jgi:ectoine hydroxylase-related dioxygenase (phytanoyl-CoA dioxygenase family)
MRQSIDPRFKKALLEEGVAMIPRFLDASQLARLQACFEWSTANPGPISVGTGTDGSADINWRDYHNPKAPALYREAIAATPFASLLREVWSSEHIWYHGEEPFLKKGNAERTAWHQDLPYVSWKGEHWVNCWISFDALPKTHSIEVIRGSHLGPLYEDRAGVYAAELGESQAAILGEESDAPVLPDIEAERRKSPAAWDVVSFDIEPGDVVFLHPGSLHSGPATDERVPLRRTLVLRFFGDKSYWSAVPESKLLSEEQNRIVYGSKRGTPGEPYRDPQFLQLY